MKKFLLGFTLLFTSACSAHHVYGQDGYRFLKPQYSKDTIQVNVHLYKDSKALAKSAAQHGTLEKRIMAFSVVSPNGNVCEMHIVEPSKDYMPEAVGHEFFHCLYGQWHKGF